MVFRGAHVIVTGGSSGIGLACARALADRGAHIALVARDAGRLEIARRSVAERCADPSQVVITRSADLSSWEATREAFNILAEEDFTPHILINSAGVIIPGEFSAMSLADFEANMTAGFWSVVHACKAAAPRMMAASAGHIVNVSSVAGFLGIYGYTGYAAAKYATLGFTEALRFELKPHGITVSVVLPPDTDTPGLVYEKTLRPKETEAIAAAIKPIAAERVAAAVIRGIERKRFHIIPDATSRFYFRFKGLLPEVFFHIVDADIAKARRMR